MMLKADRIAALLREGQKPNTQDPLVITPQPDLKVLEDSGAASVDLRLGTWFLTLRPARMTHLSIQGRTAEPQLTRTQYVPFGKQYYLHPGHFVLGVTLEWIRLPRNCGGYVIGKSSWGRRGLVIATAAGVHPGFTGCLTLELSNVGEIPIEIKPGMSICQLFIHNVEGTGDSIDASRFVGLRKPILGDVEPDAFAKLLGQSGNY